MSPSKSLGVLLLAAHPFFAFAATLSVPVQAPPILELLPSVLEKKWQSSKLDAPYFASQIEQESCISLKHSKCFNPRAELKTSREYGFGLGQITIAYDKQGKVRFNNFEGFKKLDPELKNWSFENRFDTSRQLTVVVLADKAEYDAITGVPDEFERKAMMFAAYNGGRKGLLQDRILCSTKPNCDKSRWYNNVELHSYKARVAVAGYGKSFFDINREYPRNIQKVRVQKYMDYYKGRGYADQLH